MIKIPKPTSNTLIIPAMFLSIDVVNLKPDNEKRRQRLFRYGKMHTNSKAKQQEQRKAVL
jgi:hypothetical protein